MVRATAFRALVVVVLVAGAGCGQSGQSTPAAGVNDGNGGELTAVAPGVGQRAGLANVSALLTEHRRSLRESGFAYRFANERVQRVTRPDQPTRRTVETAVTGRVVAGSGLSPYLVNETDATTEPATVTVRYVGSEGGARRVVRGDDTTVEAYDETATVLLTTHYLMHDFLSRGDWVVTNRSDGSVVLEAGPTWSEWTNESAGSTNVAERTYFEGELRVSTEGRIQRLAVNQTAVERVTRDGTLQSRGVTVRDFEFELLETGRTGVDRPAWAAAVDSGTTPGNGTATDGGTTTAG